MNDHPRPDRSANRNQDADAPREHVLDDEVDDGQCVTHDWDAHTPRPGAEAMCEDCLRARVENLTGERAASSLAALIRAAGALEVLTNQVKNLVAPSEGV